jgi:hypothetical protein
MLECCSCPLSANDLLTLSVNNQLMQNPLTGFPAPSNGVIKIVSDYKTKCNAEVLTNPNWQLLAFGTHIQQPVTGQFVTTETAFAPRKRLSCRWLARSCISSARAKASAIADLRIQATIRCNGLLA